MNAKSDLRQFLVIFGATCAVLILIVTTGLIEQAGYTYEKGRLRAIRESLDHRSESQKDSVNNGLVAQAVMPAVVSLEAEYVVLATENELRLQKPNPHGNDQRPGAQTTDRANTNSTSDSDSAQPSRDQIGLPFFEKQGLGSGFIFQADKGYVLTNAHVVKGASRIIARLADGREVKAQVLGLDSESDLAVLKIDLDHLHQLSFGSSEAVTIGEEVLALGSPFGLDGTVSKGIVSAIGRRNIILNGESYPSLIQTDAIISPGSSGGPLVDMRGQVIGINTAMATTNGHFEGVGFAIPSTQVVAMLDDLVDGGPAFLGVWLGQVSDSQQDTTMPKLGWSHHYGALVTEIIRGTGADLAEIHTADVLLSINGDRIESVESVGKILNNIRPGSRVNVELWRDGKTMKVPVTVSRRYSPR